MNYIGANLCWVRLNRALSILGGKREAQALEADRLVPTGDRGKAVRAARAWPAPLPKRGDSLQSLATVRGPCARTRWLLHKA